MGLLERGADDAVESYSSGRRHGDRRWTIATGDWTESLMENGKSTGTGLTETVMKRIHSFLAPALVSGELLYERIRLAMWAYENDRSLIKQKIERG